MGNSNALKGTAISVIHAANLTFSPSSWDAKNIGRWITEAGGKYIANKCIPETTHLICSEKAWKTPHPQVQAALNARTGIKILTPEWLEDALGGRRKPKPEPYLWDRIDRAAEEKERKDRQIVERVEKSFQPKKTRPSADGGPLSHQGMLKEVLEENTEMYASREQKRQIEREIAAKKREAVAVAKAEAERKEKEREEEKTRKKEAAAVFRRGGVKARNEIFSDNHHLYKDETGFTYDVMLTKVDTKMNRNERYALTLQIYESNNQPHTYAVNAQFAGTGRLPSNNIIAAIGTSFHTALRSFKKVFKEKAKIDWDDRISFAVERAKREKRSRGQATGSPDDESQRGRPVTDAEAQQALEASEDADFAKRPFIYLPPLYGPRGRLPEKAKEVFSEVGPAVKRQKASKMDEEIELWMSGADGAGSSPSGDDDELQIIEGPPQRSERQKSDWEIFESGGLDNDGGTKDPSSSVRDGTRTEDEHANVFGDLETGYPFDHEEPSETVPETQTQSFGHTQAAGAIHDEMEQMMDEQQERSVAGHNSGKSVLGKRKSPPTDVHGRSEHGDEAYKFRPGDDGDEEDAAASGEGMPRYGEGGVGDQLVLELQQAAVMDNESLVAT